MFDAAASSHPLQGLLDTDFYKLTMMQGVLHNFPNAEVEWEFRCRSGEDLRADIGAIRQRLDEMADMRLLPEELSFLKGVPFFTPDFIRFLALFRFDPRYVDVGESQGEVYIRIHGPWLHVILFEVPMLAIVSELRNRRLYPQLGSGVAQASDRLHEKLEWLRKGASPEELRAFCVADFGTRRRFSYAVHHEIVKILAEEFPGRFVGTSNIHLARLLGLLPLGTMAHEWFMAHQQLGMRLVDSQKAALETWVKEYRGLLGIALTDTINMDVFLRDFDLYFAKLFDGLRHDSGDPLIWAEKAIAHYRSMGIDPRTKTLMFSDALGLAKALHIYRALHERINVSFGIGTGLTCDLPGVKPLNAVVKMTSCNGQPVAKISDEPGKTQCNDENYVVYLKHVFRVAG